jgi:hypothetical protein
MSKIREYFKPPYSRTLFEVIHTKSTKEEGEWGVGSGEWGVGSGEWGVGSGVAHAKIANNNPLPPFVISFVPLCESLGFPST